MLAYSFNPLFQVSVLNLFSIYIYIYVTHCLALAWKLDWASSQSQVWAGTNAGIIRWYKIANQCHLVRKPLDQRKQHWGHHRFKRLLDRVAGNSSGWRCCTSRQSLSARPSFDLFQCNIAKIWKELEEGVRRAFWHASIPSWFQLI